MARWTLLGALALGLVAVLVWGIAGARESGDLGAAEGAHTTHDAAALEGRALQAQPEAPAREEENDDVEAEADASTELTDDDRVRISGTFTDADGRGMAYAPVTLEGNGGRWRWTLKTNADGTFERSVWKAWFPVVVLPGRKKHVLRELGCTVTLDAPRAALRMPAERWIAGEVIDERGDPIPGVRLESRAGSKTTRSDGTFRILLWGRHEDLTYWITPPPELRKRGYAPESLEGVQGGQHHLRIRLKRSEGLIGSLRWDDGEPVRNVALYLLPAESATGSGTDPAPLRVGRYLVHHPDPQGDICIAPLAPGSYRLLVGRGASLRVLDQVDVRAPMEGGKIVIRRPVRLTGRLPVADAAAWGLAWVPEGPRIAHMRCEPEQVMGSDGRFMLHVAARWGGTLYAVSVHDDRYAVQRVARPGAGPVELTPAEGRSIRGRVTGAPPGEGAWRDYVRAVQGPLRLTFRLDGNGTFHLQGLPPGTWKLSAYRWVGSSKTEPLRGSVTVQAGAEDVVIALAKDG